jgi:hypothetical protein
MLRFLFIRFHSESSGKSCNEKIATLAEWCATPYSQSRRKPAGSKEFYFIGVFHPNPRMLDFIDKVKKTLSIKSKLYFFCTK